MLRLFYTPSTIAHKKLPLYYLLMPLHKYSMTDRQWKKHIEIVVKNRVFKEVIEYHFWNT